MLSQPQNPFDAAGWTSGIELDFLNFPALVINTATPILTPDTQRLWFCVMGFGSIGDWGLWPYELPSVGGIKQTPGTGYVLIHNASYPSAVQLQWYLHMGATSGPVKVMVARSNPRKA